MSLQGTLSTLGITEVLEFLAQREATGQLDIQTEMGSANYLFSGGAVAHCDYSFIRESGTDSAEATYYVVSELEGTFFFEENPTATATEDTEEVAAVLSRTAEIAEKWGDVEEKIPTPNHLLVRNTELDGSVTIQPEWWRTLEVIGEGKTSLQVASATDKGVLAASLLLLDMTNAGLLNVEQIDPMSLEVPEIGGMTSLVEADAPVEALAVDTVDTSVAGEPESPVEIETPEAVQPAPVIEVEPLAPPEASTIPDMALGTDAPGNDQPEPTFEPAAAEEVAIAEPVAQPAPSPAVAETPVETFAPAFEPTVETPAVETPAPVDSAPAADFTTPTPAPAAPAPAPVVSTPAADFTPTPAPAAPAAPVAPAPVAEFTPTPAPAAPAAAVAPAPAPAFIAPAPAPVVAEEDDGWASNHSPSYDSGPTAAAPAAPAPMAAPAHQPAPMPQADSTAVAGEVINDLATLGDDLATQPATANWQLDDTFAAETQEVAAPSADENPFGALDNLLSEEESDEDRGSVLKFLRRD